MSMDPSVMGKRVDMMEMMVDREASRPPEHLTHISQAIPYLILLACPLMHLFHGHGHRGHQGHGPPDHGSPQQ